jgi:3-phosphoshikimate 1-carboxyvinyltransferase
VTIARAPAASRDHTERLLAAQGARVEVDGSTVAVHGDARLNAVDVVVPGDSSSAAYWLALACIHPDAEITVENVGMNPGRTGFVEILREMGGDVEVRQERIVAGEPRADLVARSSRLRGVSVGGDVIPRAIDELPLVAIVALFAEGVTEIRDAAELRVKESDRIASLGRELTRLGGQVEEFHDGLRVLGGAALEQATCETLGDHRLAMGLAVAGLAGSGVDVIDPRCAVVSYPGFWQQVRAVGGTVEGVDPA